MVGGVCSTCFLHGDSQAAEFRPEVGLCYNPQSVAPIVIVLGISLTS